MSCTPRHFKPRMASGLCAATFVTAPVHAAPPQSRDPPSTSSACRIRTDHTAWQGIPLGLDVSRNPGGTTVLVLTGTVVDSLFRGATVVQTKLLPATDLTACLTS
ncbi:hypothetical protein AB0H12_41550 [Actinosynnema sp. NPDC023794]